MFYSKGHNTIIKTYYLRRKLRPLDNSIQDGSNMASAQCSPHPSRPTEGEVVNIKKSECVTFNPILALREWSDCNVLTYPVNY